MELKFIIILLIVFKVMLDVPDEVNVILSGKLALKYNGSDLEAMKAIAEAAKKRSLADFNAVFCAFKSKIHWDQFSNLW